MAREGGEVRNSLLTIPCRLLSFPAAGVGAKAPEPGWSRPLFPRDTGERKNLFPEVSPVDFSVPLRTGWVCLTRSWWRGGGVGRWDFWGCEDHPGSVPFPNGRRFGFRTAHALALGISTLDQQNFQILERRETGTEAKGAAMLCPLSLFIPRIPLNPTSLALINPELPQVRKCHESRGSPK